MFFTQKLILSVKMLKRFSKIHLTEKRKLELILQIAKCFENRKKQKKKLNCMFN